MSDRVLVVCASRNRSFLLKDMLESMLNTSVNADIGIYLDEDNEHEYDEIRDSSGPRVSFIVGPRIGHVPALNEVARRFPGYIAYGLATDDSLFLTPGWDVWAISTARQFRGGIGTFSPYFGKEGRNDFPWVTGGWIKAVGSYGLTESKFYYWDIAIRALGELAECVVYAKKGEFAMEHLTYLGTPDEPNRDLSIACFVDAKRTCIWFYDDVRDLVQRIRDIRGS